MKKELKYFLYVFTILGFVFFIINYYISNDNKKNSYRTSELYDNKINEISSNLKILESDTDNIVEYVESSSITDKKKYNFLELLFDNEK